MTKFKIGQTIQSWQEFIEVVQTHKYFYFHDELTLTQVVLGWQLATVLRYCDRPGALKIAEPQ